MTDFNRMGFGDWWAIIYPGACLVFMALIAIWITLGSIAHALEEIATTLRQIKDRRS